MRNGSDVDSWELQRGQNTWVDHLPERARATFASAAIALSRELQKSDASYWTSGKNSGRNVPTIALSERLRVAAAEKRRQSGTGECAAAINRGRQWPSATRTAFA
jgi:hypothetical protein